MHAKWLAQIFSPLYSTRLFEGSDYVGHTSKSISRESVYLWLVIGCKSGMSPVALVSVLLLLLSAAGFVHVLNLVSSGLLFLTSLGVLSSPVHFSPVSVTPSCSNSYLH